MFCACNTPRGGRDANFLSSSEVVFGFESEQLPNQNAMKRLKRVLIVSRSETPRLEKLLMENDFMIVERNPDFIVCYGGDGTVLFSERKFPQVPKLIVKRTNVCRKCDYTLYEIENVLAKIRDGKFKMRKEIKLETRFKNEKMVGLNEIQIRAKLPIYAVRFSLSANGKEFNNLVGDGVIVATPFGSTGYYKSTGGKPFNKGIGISFNNLHDRKIKSFVVPEDSTIEAKVNRGSALVLADNDERFFELEDNEVSSIRESKSRASFIYVPRMRD